MTYTLKVLLLSACVLMSSSSFAQDDWSGDGAYRRATDDKDNVKDKLFTKKGRVELSLPDFGWILNTAFVQTYLLHGGITYYTSEEWGYNIEGMYGINSDKDERGCLENFYNDPIGNVEDECGSGEGLDPNGKTSNYGPAYMPIRQINYILAGNVVWNPVYGKQLMFLSATNYFDVFLTLGGGVVMSDYYEQQSTLNNGKKSRGPYNSQTTTIEGGAHPSETDSYGEAGRPSPQSQTNPFINMGIGQKYHFMKRFSVKFEFRDMLLLGTPGGFENYFAIWTGLGMRF